MARLICQGTKKKKERKKWACVVALWRLSPLGAFDFILVFPYEKWLSVPFVNSKICRTDGKTDSSRFIFYKAVPGLQFAGWDESRSPETPGECAADDCSLV